MSRLPAELSLPGAEITLTVTPRAARDRVVWQDGELRIYVTAVPENGKATAAVQKLLAKELGLAKSRLTLIRGTKARQKTFRVS